MGHGVSVEILADQDAVPNPKAPEDLQTELTSGKVILSQSLEDFEGVDLTSFANELIQSLRSPPPYSELVMKAEEFKEDSPDVFKYKVTLDGEKLKAYGQGDGSDVVAIHRDVKFNREARVLQCWDYFPDKERETKFKTSSVTHLLENPVRCEAYLIVYDEEWGGTADGVRKSDDFTVAGWKVFVDPVCTLLSKNKVRCKADQPSLTGSGELAVVSDNGLDQFTNIDAFKASYLKCAVEVAKQIYAQEEVPPEIQLNDEGTEATVSGALGPDKLQMIQKMTFDKDTMEIKDETTVNGVDGRKVFTKIVWPRVESYALLPSGQKLTGGSYTRECSHFINAVVTQLENEGSLFGGWFG